MGVVPFSRPYAHTPQAVDGIGDRRDRKCPILHKFGVTRIRRQVFSGSAPDTLPVKRQYWAGGRPPRSPCPCCPDCLRARRNPQPVRDSFGGSHRRNGSVTSCGHHTHVFRAGPLICSSHRGRTVGGTGGREPRPDTSGSAGCGTSCGRWHDIRSECIHRDVRRARRCDTAPWLVAL